MKTYEITIKPTSGFGTPLKGDTLFGHICWQVAYDDSLLGMSISKLLADYTASPFLIVSSAFPKINNSYALKRPDMPLDMLFDFSGNSKADIIAKRKELKSRHWMFVKNGSRVQSIISDELYKGDEQLFSELFPSKDVETQRQMRKKGIKSFVIDYTQSHNTINRLTGKTGEGQFAPYSVDQRVFINEAELVIFAGLRDDITIEGVVRSLKQIGASGFGKDASTGLGRFEVSDYKEIDLCTIGADNPNACYTLAPSVPEKDAFSKMFFTPFTRFGRHGDVLAKSGRPFKNPVIMADEGAVFVAREASVFNKPFIGTAVLGISKAEPNSVTQGYSLYIPIKVEVSDE
ncbi:MAG: type III-A CRISPR-associated RAMP protein Csm4 [Thermodesulfovibrionales bacterium]